MAKIEKQTTQNRQEFSPHTDKDADKLRMRAEKKPKPERKSLSEMTDKEINSHIHKLEGHVTDLETENKELRENEEQLMAFNARYADLYDSSPVGYFTFNKKGLILEANLTSSSLLGIKKNSLLNTSLYDYVPEEDRDILSLHLKDIFTAKISQKCELRLKKKNKTMFHALLESIVVQDKKGKFTQCRTAISDITNRKQSEEHIARINECFLKFEPDPLKNINLLVELCGVLLNATCALYNRIDDGLLYSWGQWNAPSGYNPVDNPEGHICNDLINSNSDEPLIVRNLPETPYAQSDPNVIPYNLHTYIGKAVKFSKKNIGSLCAVFQHDLIPDELDLKILKIIASAIGVEEDRRRTEDKLRLSEERFRIAFHTSNDVINISDIDGTIVNVNDGFTRLTGYTKEYAIGKTITDLKLWYDAAIHERFITEIQKKGNIKNFEAEFKLKDGSLKTGLVSADIIEIEDKPHILSITRDITERKQTEKELQESERKYRSLITNIPDVTWTTDDKGKTTFVSLNIEQIHGYTPEEIYNEGDYIWLGRIHPDDIENVISKYKDLFEKGTHYDIEYRIQRKDGKWIWAHDRAINTYMKSGTMYADGVFSDITERKQAEDALRKSETQKSTILQTAIDGFWLIDECGKFLDVNDASCNMTGYSKEEMLSMSIMDIDANEIEEDTVKRIELVRNKGFDRFEIKHRCKDGSILDIEVSTTWIPSQNNFFAFLQDITDRKQAVKALKESEEKWRSLAENIPAFVTVLDREGIILSLNRSLPQFSTEQVVGTSIYDYSIPENYKTIKEKIEEVFETDCSVTFENQGIGPEDKPVWYENYLAPVEGQDQVDKIILISQDITERKQAEQALQESEEKYSTLVEHAKDGVGFAQDGVFKFVNKAMVDITGYSIEELTGMSFLDLLVPEYKDQILQISQLRLEGKEAPAFYETKILCKDGTVKDVEAFGTVIHYDGRAANMGMIRDITERKRTEDALRKSEERFKNLLEDLSETAYETDSSGNVIYSNKMGATITGMPLEDIVGKPFLPLFIKESQEIALDQYKKTLNGENTECELTFLNGKTCSFKNKPFIDKNGTITGVFGIARDITEQKQADMALKESEEKYHRAFHDNPCIIIITRLKDGKILEINNTFTVKTGYSYEEVTGRTTLEMNLFANPGERSNYKKYLENDGSIQKGEFDLKTKSGEILKAQFSATVFLKNGEECTLATVEDITKRKLAEISLQDSRERLSTFMQSAPESFGIYDSELNLIDINKAGLKWWPDGTKKEDLIGRNIREIGPDTDENERYNQYMDVIKTGNPVCSDEIIPHPEFGEAYLEVRVFKVGDGIGMIIKNITIQKQAEKELRMGEEKLRSLVENAPDIIINVDTDGIIQFINHPLPGVSRENIIGKNILNFTLKENRDTLLSVHKNVLETGVSENYEVPEKDTGLWYDTRVGALTQNNEIVGLTLISTDITEKKQTRDRIKRLNELLRTIRNITQLITHEKERKKLIKRVCSKLIMIQGYTDVWIILFDEHKDVIAASESGLGKNFKQMVEKLASNAPVHCVKKALKQSRIVVIEKPTSACGDCPISNKYKNNGRMLIQLEYNNKIYGVLSVGIQSAFIADNEEKILLKEFADDIAFALANIDLEEEQKRLQEQLYKSSRLSAVGQLASGVAHEFNNMLSVIMGHAQISIIEDSIPEIKQSLQTIERTARQGSTLVKKLSTFAMPKKPEFISQKITSVIDALMILQERQFSLNNITVKKEYKKHSKVSFDWGQMEQVFINLLINATHAIKSKGKGTISISVQNVNHHVEIRFSDTGIGMDDETKAKIFDPFFSTKGAWATNGLGIPGNGLGLSISHTIIEQHNGTIQVESKQNKGTTFIISLPAAKSDLLTDKTFKQQKNDANIKKIKDLRILIADDDDDLVELLNLLFKKAKFKNYRIVSNGEQAIKSVKTFKPDLVILDMVMPDMNGEQVFNEIKLIDKKMPIAFMSGKIDVDKNRYLEMGAYDFIQKPFNIHEIYDILNTIVE